MAAAFIAGNWKMNTSVAEAVALAQQLRGPLESMEGIIRLICPPFVSLAPVAHVLEGSTLELGAQDLHPEPKGAFTGEVSGAMLEGLCRYVIVGHSERRHIMGETDETVNRKVTAALRHDLVPILCVGEILSEREEGRAKEVVTRQLNAGFQGLDLSAVGWVVIAYEPVWAIGTGKAATAEQAQEMMGVVRAWLSNATSQELAQGVPLLYGGSVTADNVAQFAAERDIDGALVGGASLRAEEFVAIAQGLAQAAAGS